MNVRSDNDSKGLLNITILLVEGLIAKYRKERKINSDSSGQKYVHLSNGSIQSYEICHTFTV